MTQKSFKKVTLFVFALFILFSCFFSYDYIKVSAASVPSGEFIPYGINYIDSSNIIYRPNKLNKNACSIETVSMIKVKSNTEYGFYFAYDTLGNVDSFTIKGYNEYGKYLMEIESTPFENCYNRRFTIPSTVKYITFKAEISKYESANISLSNISDCYFLIEYHQDVILSDYTDEELEYKGPNYSNYKVLASEELVKSYMSSPLSKSDIKNMILAIDDYDGNVTTEIEEVSNNYEPTKKAGTYDINYYVSDSAGNENTLKLKVLILDDVEPVITGQNVYNTNQLVPLNVETIRTSLKANDNNDGDISYDIEIDTDNYSGNENEPGSYEILFFVQDSAGNTTYYSVIVNVDYKDDEAPVIGGEDKYIIKNTETLTLEQIINNVTVTDNIDNNLKDSIVIEYDDFSMNVGKVGLFSVILAVSDSTGNKTTKTITIQINDAKSPIFILNTKNVYLQLSESMVSTNDIYYFLEKTNNINGNYEYEVIYDEYTLNKNTPGQYQVVYKVNDTETRVLVNVMNKMPEVNSEISTFEKFILFFKNLFRIIIDFFKGLFS